MSGTSPQAACPLCGGSKCLSQRGIAIVYLLPHWWAVGLMVAGVALAVARGAAWLWLCALGYLLPLAMADLRLLLYPWVAIAAQAGRQVNCPRCEPAASVFRH